MCLVANPPAYAQSSKVQVETLRRMVVQIWSRRPEDVAASDLGVAALDVYGQCWFVGFSCRSPAEAELTGLCCNIEAGDVCALSAIIQLVLYEAH